MFADASLNGVGGALCVYRNSSWIPCGFFSRQLLIREKNYAILDLEALALLATIQHFHYYLSGKYFKAFYYRSQTTCQYLNGQPPSSRLLRWKIKVSEYHFDLLHISGEANPIADALSRQSWNSSPDEDVSLKKLEEASLKEGEVW